jgi:hypothetical protein
MADREYTAKDAQPIVNYGYKGTAISPFQIDANGNLKVVEGTIPADYDYVDITYDANFNPLVMTFKKGGALGTTVMTKTMVYDANDNQTSITIT